jgi:hypothetical protein
MVPLGIMVGETVILGIRLRLKKNPGSYKHRI